MTDFVLDTNGDLLITEADFVLDDSTQQHQKLLLLAAKGDFKENPTATVGLINYVESENEADMLREIRKCFANDGLNIKTLAISNDGKLLIDAGYNS